MFKHILVAIDGSEYSRSAVPTAIEVAKKFKSDIYVLHVLKHGYGRAVYFPLTSVAEADALLAEAIETVKGAGVGVKGEVVHGYAKKVPEVIADTAHQLGCDLIVMGSRGLSDAAGVFLGSVAHGVIHLAQVTVMVDRTPTKAAPTPAVPVGAGVASL